MKKTFQACMLAAALGSLLPATPLSAQPVPGDKPTEEEDRQKEAAEAARLRDLFLRQEKIFIGRGELIAELSIFYSTDTSTQVIAVDGGRLAVVKAERRAVDTSLMARYGLWNGLELDARVPFVHALQELDTGAQRTRQEDEGIGDVSGALRYQVVGERGGRPDVILDLTGKSRTGGDTLRGTGHWNVGAGITLVKTIDPVVFFGRAGYTATLEREGRNPGDILEYRLGMGFSLNDRVSFNMQLTGAVVGRTEVDGRELRGSSLELMSLVFTSTVLVTKRLYVEPTVGVGLTDDASDVFVGLRLPYRF